MSWSDGEQAYRQRKWVADPEMSELGESPLPSSGQSLPAGYVVHLDNEANYVFTSNAPPGDSSDSHHRPPRKQALQLIVAALCGLVFGFSFEKAKGYQPYVVRAQFYMYGMVLVKMMLSAAATTMVLFWLMDFTPTLRSAQRDMLKGFESFTKRSVAGVAAGGFLLGTGMYLCGACPASIGIHLALNVSNAWMTLLGAIVGALLFAAVEQWLQVLCVADSFYRSAQLPALLRIKPAWLVLPTATIMFVAVILLEAIYSSEREYLGKPEKGVTWLHDHSWPAYASGIVLGLLQVPLAVGVGEVIDLSVPYCWLPAQLLRSGRLQSALPHLAELRSSASWCKVVFAVAAAAGAALSMALYSGTPFLIGVVSKPQCFFGGLLVIFGSRLAAGCDCTHGIAGAGLLIIHSLMALPFILIGGSLGAIILRFG